LVERGAASEIVFYSCPFFFNCAVSPTVASDCGERIEFGLDLEFLNSLIFSKNKIAARSGEQKRCARREKLERGGVGPANVDPGGRPTVFLGNE